MLKYKRPILLSIYVLATIQVAWCYFSLSRSYVSTAAYESGLERMPFQGRCLMMMPMRLAHHNPMLRSLSLLLNRSRFWFPHPVEPEWLVQGIVDIGCLLLAGYLTTRIYRASSRLQLLAPAVYPLFLVVCAATYVLHTAQNFRFLYDLPSLCFFSIAMYLVYFRRHWGFFVALFLVATVNRETTLLLLPLYMIDGAVSDGAFRWKQTVRARSLLVVGPLALFWIGWQVFIRHTFAHNPSEFYPRINWNVKSLLAPQAWPQLLSACGYLLLFVVFMRRYISDPRLRSWLWILPPWTAFMFSFGILVETRVFGELIPFVVCASTLIFEEMLAAKMQTRVTVTNIEDAYGARNGAAYSAHEFLGEEDGQVARVS